ncbi:alpha,alpha-trehalase TreF [Hymenobacter rubripertinctus]|uniref:Alpha,alpha-trehalase TreF n=1 Tax=Hymenobacter rubripertinctus TaxID=2029981 RepID=A0A418QRR0_9BACT|nr:alpha,alpha-trehalase TreF [Hymenobacter rubripertinctus]RIY07813.1 alpha,alpha-trehalase TreF [Hymenobacter rubripertinctus]
MIRLLLLLSGLLLSLALPAQPPTTLPPSPRQLFPGLFEAVQLGRVFPDNKTFVDAEPRDEPAVILAAYAQFKDQPNFRLRDFVEAYFRLPATTGPTYRTHVAAGLRHHLDTLWTVLRRPGQDSVSRYSSLLPLPQAYVVPGGRFREVYYWDSYFTLLGLRESGRPELIRGMVDNFAYLISRYGFIPNGNRTYYLTRSQPPFFGRMVALLAGLQPRPAAADSVRLAYHPALLREYQFWMAAADSVAPGQARRSVVRLPDGTLLNRYWDRSAQPREESYQEDVAVAARTTSRPAAGVYRDLRAAAASGWDFSSRWLVPGQGLESIRTTELVPVDLNCLLYEVEGQLAHTSRLRGEPALAQRLETRARARRRAIRRYCWDEQANWFVDYDWVRRQPAPVRTLAGVVPLTVGVASRSQARHVAAGLRQNFLRPGGLVTTLSTTGQQWDAPNAWAPLQWLAVTGLRRYGETALAQTIVGRWTGLNEQVFRQTGKLMEKYDVDHPATPGGGGEYPLQDGFGWTNGVLLDFLRPAAPPPR